jgi:hypothetical protein
MIASIRSSWPSSTLRHRGPAAAPPWASSRGAATAGPACAAAAAGRAGPRASAPGAPCAGPAARPRRGRSRARRFSISAEHVAHADDSRGHPLGVEKLEVLGFLAGATEADRHLGDAADGERGAAAGVAVELGEDRPGERQRFGEGAGALAPRPGRSSRRRRRASPTGCRRSTSCCSSAISAGSTWRRPAVSKTSTSWPRSRAARKARSASCSHSFTRLGHEHRHASRGPPARAARRRRRAAGRRPPAAAGGRALLQAQASLPAVVVLPEPCRPQSRTTAGRPSRRSSCPGSPSRPVSSSRTILTTCCAGVRLASTSSSTARSRTRCTKALTTRKWTSASSSARRISRSAASRVSAVSRPSPRRLRKTSWSLPCRPSNMA